MEVSMADFAPNTFGQQVRPAVDSDWDAIASLMNHYDAEGTTGDILRQRNSLWDANDPRMIMVATDDLGKIMGYCRSQRRSSEPAGIFRLSIYVDPVRIGHGIGRYLLSISERFAKERGAQFPMTMVEETCKRGLDFAAKNGYTAVQHLFESRLELVYFDPSPYQMAQSCLEDEGFRFRTFQDLGASDADWQHLWELDTVTDRDTPGSEFWSIGSLSVYRAQKESAFGFSPAHVHIAIFNNEWVGVNMVNKSPNRGEMATEYTGVRKDFRGKGLAQVLKAIGIQAAKETGAQVMVTNNDERNAAMLAVNKKLGFAVQPGFFVMRKAF